MGFFVPMVFVWEETGVPEEIHLSDLVISHADAGYRTESSLTLPQPDSLSFSGST